MSLVESIPGKRLDLLPQRLRLAALRLVVEEKLVKRGVSLKGLDYGKIEEATQNSVRQVLTIAVGIGANTTLFSVYDRLVLNPVTIPRPSSPRSRSARGRR